MTVLYIWTPLARLNKGANAVVLEVNCFKVCLSAMMMMMMLFVVRVKWPPVFLLSRSSHLVKSRCGLFFWSLFRSLAREHVARSCVFDLFFFAGAIQKIWEEKLCFSAPSSSFSSHLSLTRSLALFLSFSFSLSRERKKHNFEELWWDALLRISSSVKHTHNASYVVFVAIYCFYYIQQ